MAGIGSEDESKQEARRFSTSACEGLPSKVLVWEPNDSKGSCLLWRVLVASLSPPLGRCLWATAELGEFNLALVLRHASKL